MTEDIVSTLRPITVVVSKDQKAIEIPKAMVIEKKLPDLLSLLEWSPTLEGATLEIPVVPKPPAPVPSFSYPN